MNTSYSDINFPEMIERMSDAFFSLDRNWCFTYINRKGAELLNCEPQELIGQYFFGKFPYGSVSQIHTKCKAAMEQLKRVEFDEYYPEPLNKWFHIQVYPSPTGVTVILYDLTEERLEKNLNDKYYEKLFTKNHDGLFTLDTNGNVVRVNLGLEKITGYSKAHFHNKKYYEPSPVIDQDIPYIQTMYQRALNGNVCDFFIDLQHKDGSILNCHVTFFPILVMDRVVAVLGVTRDLSQIKQLEWDLYRSEQRYRSLKFNNPDGICSFDLEERFKGVNPALQEMTGYSREEFLQLQLEDVFNKEDLEELKGYKQIVLNGRKTVDPFELMLMNRTGKTTPVMVKIVPIHIDQNLEGFYLIIKDIEKEKKTEERLIQSEKLSAVGQLAASVVHEIRNPLTSLMGFLQLIQNKSEARDDYIQIMMDELLRLDSITNELLLLAKPQVQKMKVEVVSPILKNVLKLMESQAKMNGIEIIVNCEDNLPEILCDAQQLKQVFINIIKNGIEAMDGKEGKIIVNTRVNKENKELIISFIDEGLGMTKEQIEYIAQPFYTTKQKGTGLGMLMTYNIIKNHNGRIEIESEIGKGTAISICLPV